MLMPNHFDICSSNFRIPRRREVFAELDILLYLITCLIFAGNALLVLIIGNARKNTKTPTNIFTVTLIWENVPTQSLAIQSYLDRPYEVPSKNNNESCN